MPERDCGRYCATVTNRAAPPDVIRQMQDYARGYADRQVESRP
jgi:hypothetical protein